MEKEELIIVERIEKTTFNHADLTNQSFGSNDCLIIDFIINTNERFEVYIMEVKSGGEAKPHFNNNGNVNFYRTNENGCKFNRYKQNKVSKAFFKVA